MTTFRSGTFKKIDLTWLLTLVGLSIYSGYSYLYNLASGARSEFYAAIATSMSKSLSNFWWGAADPAGTITLDKIPGSFWVPAIFVKIFGFSTWAVDAPNALASMALVIVVAYAAREIGGRGAGLIAGAVAAATPILSAVARSNQPQSFLLLWLSVATLFGVRALKRNSFKQLFLAGVFIALAFQSYMLVAWALWPALGLAYLFTQQKLWTKIWHLLVAGLSSLALSLVWIISVSLTPASARPYIGGSNTNNAWEMVFGYNGLGRFSDITSGTTASGTSVRGFTPPFSGDPGVFRLLNSQLLPQIGWLIPATLVAIIIIFALRNFKPTAIFVALHFVIYAAMFSVVSGMHQFYTSALAIPMAMVLATAYSTARTSNKTWVKIPVIVTAVASALIIGFQYSSYMIWAPFVQIVLGLAACALILLKVKGRAKALIPVSIAAALVFSPAVWAADTVSYPSTINPLAGPTNSMGFFGGNPMGGGQFGGSHMGTGQTGGWGIGGPSGSFTSGNKSPFGGARPNFGGARPNFGGTRPGFGSGSQPGFGGTLPKFGGNRTNSASGSQPGFSGGQQAFGGGGADADKALLAYLKKNRDGAKFLMATYTTQAAASYINATQDNVLPIGGFDGSDPSPTLKQIKAWIASGDLRFILASNGGMSGPKGQAGQSSNATATGQDNLSKIESWVTAHCKTDTSGVTTQTLYKCTPSDVK